MSMKTSKIKAKDGKAIGTKVQRDDGSVVHLLTPEGRGRKYAAELKAGADVFTGEKLTPTQASWRSGYMQARTDSAAAYNANNGKPGKGRSAIKKNGGKPTYPDRKGKVKGNRGGGF
jgi:hypothetical protein